ncbi:MAG: magnesium-protoporphyrin IX monomethyl ester (oxidative) cyclase, partial [Pseudomonadota bacterium]
TMHVRDHQRPAFHEALGVDIEEYDWKVFHLTSEISKQVFPITLDLDHPALVAGFKRMVKINDAIEAANQRGGIAGNLAKAWHGARAVVNFARIYMVPAQSNDIPATSRLHPVW